jgi:hypothetical protein
MTDMREAVARVIKKCPACDGYKGKNQEVRFRLVWVKCEHCLATGIDLDAMQPEIDRRVAEERTKMLSDMCNPKLNEAAVQVSVDALRTRFGDHSYASKLDMANTSIQAFLTQYEKENSDDDRITL